MHCPPQKAFYCHLRMMWGSFQSDVVPELPSAEAIAQFTASRFASADDLDALNTTLSGSYTTIVTAAIAAVDTLRDAARRSPGQIAKTITAMDEHWIRVAYSAVISAGLPKWRPDILGNYGSIYNQVHELIAIKTFQTIAIAHAYARLSPNLTNLANLQLLQRFYRNYLFSYLAPMVKREKKTAGSVRQVLDNTNTYKRRKEVSCGIVR